MSMQYILFMLMILLSAPAYAEFGFGGQEPGKPRSMMVGGSSVIDEEQPTETENANQNGSVEEVRDDANDMMEPARTAPPQEDIDPFSPSPQTAEEDQRNVKRVLKKIPAAKAQRSIADDRIDDGYVQQMMKNNFDFSGPIE